MPTMQQNLTEAFSLIGTDVRAIQAVDAGQDARIAAAEQSVAAVTVTAGTALANSAAATTTANAAKTAADGAVVAAAAAQTDATAALAAASAPETDPTVSAWAKAATKPTYAWNEITGLAAELTTRAPNPYTTPEQTTVESARLHMLDQSNPHKVTLQQAATEQDLKATDVTMTQRVYIGTVDPDNILVTASEAQARIDSAPYVDLSTTQNVNGQKCFLVEPAIPGKTMMPMPPVDTAPATETQVVNYLASEMAAKSVLTSTDQTIADIKTFTSQIVIPPKTTLPASAQQTEYATEAQVEDAYDHCVHLAENQTITGTKTLTTQLIVPIKQTISTPPAEAEYATEKQVVTQITTTAVMLTGSQTVDGTKTFTNEPVIPPKSALPTPTTASSQTAPATESQVRVQSDADKATLRTEIAVVQASVTAEASRATTEETTLQANIDAETQRAIGAEATELQRAAVAENALGTRIDAETLQVVATRQGITDTSITSRLYLGNITADNKYLTAGELAALYASDVNYKGKLKYGADTPATMQTINQFNLTADDECGVHSTQKTYKYSGTAWVEEPATVDKVGDMYQIEYWFGAHDGKNFRGEVSANVICKIGSPSAVFDLFIDQTILLDDSVNDLKIGTRAVLDQPADPNLISITAKGLTSWIQGIRNNMKSALGQGAAITAETTRATAAETALGTAITTAVAAEATARGTAITAAISAETTARNTAIAAETTARNTAIDGIGPTGVFPGVDLIWQAAPQYSDVMTASNRNTTGTFTFPDLNNGKPYLVMIEFKGGGGCGTQGGYSSANYGGSQGGGEAETVYIKRWVEPGSGVFYELGLGGYAIRTANTQQTQNLGDGEESSVTYNFEPTVYATYGVRGVLGLGSLANGTINSRYGMCNTYPEKATSHIATPGETFTRTTDTQGRPILTRRVCGGATAATGYASYGATMPCKGAGRYGGMTTYPVAIPLKDGTNTIHGIRGCGGGSAQTASVSYWGGDGGHGYIEIWKL